MIYQWLNPTPEQIVQAEEIGARLWQSPYWVGEMLCVDQPDSEPEPEPE